jgi:hypothetical protein
LAQKFKQIDKNKFNHFIPILLTYILHIQHKKNGEKEITYCASWKLDVQLDHQENDDVGFSNWVPQQYQLVPLT